MRTKHAVLIAILGCGALVGVAQAGDSKNAAHWNSTAPTVANEEAPSVASLRSRPSTNATPWRDMTSSADSTDPDSFHRERPMDHANPWQPGMIRPSVPTMTHSKVDKTLNL